MKENLNVFTDNNKFLTWSTLKGIVVGFIRAKVALQEQIVSLYM